MINKITDEFIIKTLIRIFEQTGEAPKCTNKIPEFSSATVIKRFGSWNKALIACGIPVRSTPPQQVSCKNCNIQFTRIPSQLKVVKNHFCSCSCATTYRNLHNGQLKESTKMKISEGVKKHRMNNKTIKVCESCNRTHTRYESKFCCQECYFASLPQKCSVCDRSFTGTKTTCSDECLQKAWKRSGRASQQSQQRRSKGEALFFNLCSSYFGHAKVKSNYQIFIDKNGNYWDCDIVVPSSKIAIAYNGIWHYEDLGGSHKLSQVQARDAIKEKVIFDNGYMYYIVKDLGKFNPDFVYREFHRFIFSTFIHFQLLTQLDEF